MSEKSPEETIEHESIDSIRKMIEEQGIKSGDPVIMSEREMGRLFSAIFDGISDLYVSFYYKGDNRKFTRKIGEFESIEIQK